MSALIPPTLRYLLALATARHPRYLIRILNNFDECYAVIFLLIERHFLREYGGSFTEHFYGLKRERVLRVKGGEVPRARVAAAAEVREALKLTNADIWKNLALIIGLPWVKRRIDEAYEYHVVPQTALSSMVMQQGLQSEQHDQLPPWDGGRGWRRRLQWYWRWFLRRVWPHLNAMGALATLVFQLAYLFDNTKFASPALWLAGTRIRRMGEADYRAIALAEQAAATKAADAVASQIGGRPGEGVASGLLHPRTLIKRLLPQILGSLRILLPTSIFALKFLEWWHASDFARQLSRKAAEGVELPPPIIAGLDRLGLRPRPTSSLKSVEKRILKDRSSHESMKTSQEPSTQKLGSSTAPISRSSQLPILTVPPVKAGDSSDFCPICLQPIKNATASPYGFVYCYSCIHRWVEGTHERQERFMGGETSEETDTASDGSKEGAQRSREGLWESGKGRDAVTGRRILGEAEGLRRVVA